MGDAAFAEVRCPPPGPPWDQRLVALSDDVRRTTARDPGSFPRFRASPKAPSWRGSSECTLGMLRDAGIGEEELDATSLAVATYIWGQLLLDTLGREALSAQSSGVVHATRTLSSVAGLRIRNQLRDPSRRDTEPRPRPA